MGTNISCNRCNKPLTNYKILYTNNEVTKQCSGKGISFKGISFMISSGLDLASDKCKEISHIVGRISVSYGIELKMEQFLCVDCYINTPFEDLPEEWSHKAEYGKNGYMRYDLP